MRNAFFLTMKNILAMFAPISNYKEKCQDDVIVKGKKSEKIASLVGDI